MHALSQQRLDLLERCPHPLPAALTPELEGAPKGLPENDDEAHSYRPVCLLRSGKPKRKTALVAQ